MTTTEFDRRNFLSLAGKGLGLAALSCVLLAAGWGTWGFKASPICGVTMAELLEGAG